MARFKVGDKVKWNSEAGYITGVVVAIMTKPFYREGKNGKKYLQHVTKDNPKYKLKSIKTGYISYHFGEALKKVR